MSCSSVRLFLCCKDTSKFAKYQEKGVIFLFCILFVYHKSLIFVTCRVKKRVFCAI